MTMTRFNGTLNGQPVVGIINEYLRRNLLQASAVGAEANAKAALKRVRGWKNPPKWLVKELEGIAARAKLVAEEMAEHRDELDPTLEVRKSQKDRNEAVYEDPP